MYLLKVRIVLYKDRKSISFVADRMCCYRVSVHFHELGGLTRHFAHMEIHKLSVTAFKFVKQIGS